MKKFIRYLRLRRQSPPDHDEHGKKRQRYEADYTLEPFAGLTPEYMEMSEWGRGAWGGWGGSHSPVHQRGPRGAQRLERATLDLGPGRDPPAREPSPAWGAEPAWDFLSRSAPPLLGLSLKKIKKETGK